MKQTVKWNQVRLHSYEQNCNCCQFCSEWLVCNTIFIELVICLCHILIMFYDV